MGKRKPEVVAVSQWEREMMRSFKSKPVAAAKHGSRPDPPKRAHGDRDLNRPVGPIRGHVVDERGVDEEEFQRDVEHAAKRCNIKLYNRLITKYGKLHAVDKCQALFQQASAACELNEFSWGCLINAYSRCGNPDKAQEVLRDYAAQQPGGPNAVMYTSVIKALSNDGRLSEAVRWLRDMQDRAADQGGDGSETQRAYGAILRGCVRCGESQLALRLYDELLQRPSAAIQDTAARQSVRQACSLDPVPAMLTRALALLEDLPRDMAHFDELPDGRKSAAAAAAAAAARLASSAAVAGEALLAVKFAELLLVPPAPKALRAAGGASGGRPLSDGQAAALTPADHILLDACKEAQKVGPWLAGLGAGPEAALRARLLVTTRAQSVEGATGRTLAHVERDQAKVTSVQRALAAYKKKKKRSPLDTGKTDKLARIKAKISALKHEELASEAGMGRGQPAASGAVAEAGHAAGIEAGTGGQEQERREGQGAVMEWEGVMRWPELFAADGGAARPVCVEVGCGMGEWVVERAEEDAGVLNWVAVEQRYDRAYATYLRANIARAAVVVVEADVLALLQRQVEPGSVSQVVMSFPEPHGPGALATNGSFLRAAHRALVRGGKLTIVTDQRSVFDGATQELQTPSLRKCFRLASESSGGKVMGGGERGGAVLPKGWEHGGSSFFNGLWVSRGFTDRFFLSYTAL